MEIVMRLTKFMVDRTQPTGTMKVGTQWRGGHFREGWSWTGPNLPVRRVDQYEWMWDAEPKPNIPLPPRVLNVIWLRDKAMDGEEVKELKLAFEVDRLALGQELGEFSLDTASMVPADIATITTQPVPTGTARGAGLITITTDKLEPTKVATFELLYTPKEDDAEPIRMYVIHVLTDKDWMRAPMVGGPWTRQGGRWIEAE